MLLFSKILKKKQGVNPCIFKLKIGKKKIKGVSPCFTQKLEKSRGVIPWFFNSKFVKKVKRLVQAFYFPKGISPCSFYSKFENK